MSATDPALVSVIIPVYNRAELLQESVASVLAQTYRPVEIIVVNDGSTDDTISLVDYMAEQHEEVTALHIENCGPGGAREVGRKIARGEYIQYLDSDDLLMPNKFEVQVRALRKNPDCDIAYGKTRYYHLDEQPVDVALKRTGEKIEYMFPSFLESRWWSTHTPLFRRKIVDRAGPWTRLRNEEDWEYDCRIAALGAKLCFCDEFLSDTRDHEEDRLNRGGSVEKPKLRDRARAHELIYRHASHFGVDKSASEMMHFARELFLLARQCGAAGLIQESQLLFNLSLQSSHQVSNNQKLYRMIAPVLGWGVMGKASRYLDRLRNSLA